MLDWLIAGNSTMVGGLVVNPALSAAPQYYAALNLLFGVVGVFVLLLGILRFARRRRGRPAQLLLVLLSIACLVPLAMAAWGEFQTLYHGGWFAWGNGDSTSLSGILLLQVLFLLIQLAVSPKGKKRAGKKAQKAPAQPEKLVYKAETRPAEPAAPKEEIVEISIPAKAELDAAEAEPEPETAEEGAQPETDEALETETGEEANTPGNKASGNASEWAEAVAKLGWVE